MIALIKKCWNTQMMRYLFFGGCATVLNITCYFLLTTYSELYYQLANVIAWIITILFAFMTNKYFVFRSNKVECFFKEMITFYAARIVTLGLELGLMWLFVQTLQMNDLLAKCIIQVVVILCNYVFSKVYIFQGGKENEG